MMSPAHARQEGADEVIVNPVPWTSRPFWRMQRGFDWLVTMLLAVNAQRDTGLSVVVNLRPCTTHSCEQVSSCARYQCANCEARPTNSGVGKVEWWCVHPTEGIFDVKWARSVDGSIAGSQCRSWSHRFGQLGTQQPRSGHGDLRLVVSRCSWSSPRAFARADYANQDWLPCIARRHRSIECGADPMLKRCSLLRRCVTLPVGTWFNVNNWFPASAVTCVISQLRTLSERKLSL